MSTGSTDKDAIKVLQSALQYLGHNVEINGTYDAATLVAVNKFKDKVIPNGNKAGNRGVVGPTTWNLIMNEVIASKTGYGYFEMMYCDQMRLGSKSDDVKRLQMALRQLSYNIGSAGIDGEFGPATQSAVNQFKNLYIPYGNAGANAGVVGATTWEYLEDQLFRSLLGYPIYKDGVALSVPAVPHVGDDIIDVALRELNAPDNTGLRYLAIFNRTNKQNWCTAFVTWCANQVGAIDSGAFPSSCPTVYSGGAPMKEHSANPGSMIYWFDSRGLFVPRYNGNNAGYTPKRGDLIFFDWVNKSTGKNDGKANHVGLVVGCENGTITTIEGNAGNGVVKSRTFSINSANIYGFGTPNY